MRNLVFIGGIHGVGKGTVCRKVCTETNLVRITASDVLKWDEISEPNDKKVDSILDTQKRLITGLSKVIKDNETYLLDGHFCLFNSKGEVEKIPKDVFKQINPKLVVIVTADVEQIQKRLKKRDNKTYGLEILRKMQITEIEYSKEIALMLNVTLFELINGNYQPLIKLI
jgi:adenylate kinase